jgi:hypothetical protein
MFLKDNAALMAEVEEKVKGVLGIVPGGVAEAPDASTAPTRSSRRSWGSAPATEG